MSSRPLGEQLSRSELRVGGDVVDPSGGKVAGAGAALAPASDVDRVWARTSAGSGATVRSNVGSVGDGE
eukprot:5010996-Pleurochrysis_carterae.AAC.1